MKINQKINFKIWIEAIRPKTLFASAGPVLLGLALVKSFLGSLNLILSLITLACTLLLQISSNLINDYYDGIKGVDHDGRLGPKRATSTGLITPQQMKIGYCLTLSMAFLLGTFLILEGGLPIFLIGFASLFFAWAYTGGPLPLSYWGLGEVLAFLFFGPIAVWGTTYLQVKTLSNQQNTIILIVGCGVGLISAALMAVNNLRDRESDLKTSKKTLAIFLGEKGARLLVITLIALSALTPLTLVFRSYGQAFLSLTLLWLFFFSTWKSIIIDPLDSSLNRALVQTGQYLFLYSLIFSAILMTTPF